MKMSLSKILLVIGLACWSALGVGLLYRYVVLERYPISLGGGSAVLVRNALTGAQWICTAAKVSGGPPSSPHSFVGCIETSASRPVQASTTTGRVVELPPDTEIIRTDPLLPKSVGDGPVTTGQVDDLLVDLPQSQAGSRPVFEIDGTPKRRAVIP